MSVGGALPRHGDGEAALDRPSLDRLAEITGGDTDVLRELVDLFVGEAPDRLREIRDGIATDDAALVRRAAHSLRSNALSFGALDLGAACAELETRAQSGDLTDAATLASGVAAEWERARHPIELLAR